MCTAYPVELEMYFLAHIKSSPQILHDRFAQKILLQLEDFMLVILMKSCIGTNVNLLLKKILNCRLNDQSRLMSFDHLIRRHEELHASIESYDSLERKKGEKEYLELLTLELRCFSKLVQEQYQKWNAHMQMLPVCS